MKTESDQSEEAFATFRIAGDKLDPRVITNLLGIIPTKSHSKGEQYRDGPYGSAVVGRTGVWLLNTDQFIGRQIPLIAHVQLAMALLGIFNPRKLSLIRKLVSEESLHIVLTFFWYGPAGAHAPEIPKEMLLTLESIPATVELDFDTDKEPPIANQLRDRHEPGAVKVWLGFGPQAPPRDGARNCAFPLARLEDFWAVWSEGRDHWSVE
jgi:hypothetical protein